MTGTARRQKEQQGDPADNRRRSLRRMLWLKIGLLLFFAVVSLRLVQIQLLEAAKYQEMARRQHETRVSLPSARGNLYDRNGTLIVSHTMYVSYGADPKMLGSNLGPLAERFAIVFGKPRSHYHSRLTVADRRFVWLERRVRPDVAKRLGSAKVVGLVQLQEPRRLYHYGQTAGQLIGFTDIDNNGLDGIELQMDRHLRGTDGFMIMQRDARGGLQPSMDYATAEPVNGRSVVLTIDIEYQSIVEEELRRGVDRAKAESGLAVMLDPATGEVLAMANYPPVDPGAPGDVDRARLKNRVITDMVEPGSVFKLVTAAAALERKAVAPAQKFFAENGDYVVRYGNEKKVRHITDVHPHGTLTFQEGMEQSSNIVMAKVSDRVGAEAFYSTARSFGFGTETGIELPGEVRGQLKKPTEWSGASLNSMAYGYEVGVTPLQIACAYAAVANRGVLMKPYVVKAMLDDEGEVISETTPQPVRTVLSKETAVTLTRFFEGVVERGTGTAAKTPVVRIAGKTGTSRKVIDGKYGSGKFMASFVGFFPAENPKIVCLVMLETAGSGAYSGGVASAPIFREIAQRVYATAGRLSKTPETAIASAGVVAVPDVRSLKTDAARSALESRGFTVALRGKGGVVRSQSPPPGKAVPHASTVTITTGEYAAAADGFTVVPDVRGFSIRRALNSLSVVSLDAGVAGSGVVVAQSPSPGSSVRTGSRVVLRCEPRGVSTAEL